jgi:hypothetical protein
VTADLVSWLHRQLEVDRAEAIAAIEHPAWKTIYLSNVPKRVPVGVSWGERRWDQIGALERTIRIAFEHAAAVDGEWGCCHTADEIEAGRCEETRPESLELLRLLAVPYAHRPGYRPEWRP